MPESHPLVSGYGAPPPIKARLELSPIPGQTCFRNLEELQQWIESGIVEFAVKSNAVMFGTAGTLNGATPQDRDKPRLMFDNEGRFLGLVLFSPGAQRWVLPGVVGELKTLVRTESDLDRDMEVKLLKGGWLICDGTREGAPDLRPVPQPLQFVVSGTTVNTEFTPETNGYFSGSEGNWDIYTVVKIA